MKITLIVITSLIMLTHTAQAKDSIGDIICLSHEMDLPNNESFVVRGNVHFAESSLALYRTESPINSEKNARKILESCELETSSIKVLRGDRMIRALSAGKVRTAKAACSSNNVQLTIPRNIKDRSQFTGKLDLFSRTYGDITLDLKCYFNDISSTGDDLN